MTRPISRYNHSQLEQELGSGPGMASVKRTQHLQNVVLAGSKCAAR